MIEKTIQELSKSLREDKDFFYSWQSIMATIFMDVYNTLKDKKDIHEIANISAETFLRKLSDKREDYMEVAEKVYYHVNPQSKMDVPNSAYITTEKWYREWQNTNTELDLFNWILENKN
jgi:hypothetical protein